jgi:hypothetical protein
MEFDFIVFKAALVCQEPDNVLVSIWSCFQGPGTQATLEPGRQHADVDTLNDVPNAVN